MIWRRIFGLLLLTSALMHFIGLILMFVRFRTFSSLSLVLGPLFLIGAIALLRSSHPIGK